MRRYYYISFIISALFGFCFVSQIQAQERISVINENVFCYITMSPENTYMKKKRKLFSILEKKRENTSIFGKTFFLLIDNQSKDTVYIENFNKVIFSKLAGSSYSKLLTWEILTLSNQIPDEAISVDVSFPVYKYNRKIDNYENIVVPPNSTFVSDFYLYQLPFSYIVYYSGFYKLCLYHVESGKCIAEMVVKH